MLLYLSHRIPYPPNKGDKIRSFNELKYLSKRHEIDLVCLADDPNDRKYEIELKRYCRRVHVEPLNKIRAKINGLFSLLDGGSISVGYFYKENVQKIVNQWLEDTDYKAIICFSSPTAEYIFRAERRVNNRIAALPLFPTSAFRSFLSLCSMPFRLRPSVYSPNSGSSALRSDSASTFNLQPSTAMTIMDFCDLDSDKWRQYAQRSKRPMNWVFKLESKRLLEFEKKVNQAFDHSLFVSQQEADLFKKALPKARNLAVIPNGVDYNYFSPDYLKDSKGQGFEDSIKSRSINPTNPKNPTNSTNPTNSINSINSPIAHNAFGNSKFKIQNSKLIESSALPRFPASAPRSFPTLIFTGAMDYHANIDGVVWFCKEIFPKIKKKEPQAQFYIVGSNPQATVKALDNINGVIVTGFVEDIRPYYQMADICVIPLRLARGVQNKVLEAMSMARPIVTTSAAIQGISAKNDKHLLVADRPEDFSQTVLNLIENKDRRAGLGNAGRNFIQKNYDWGKTMQIMDGLMHPPT